MFLFRFSSYSYSVFLFLLPVLKGGKVWCGSGCSGWRWGAFEGKSVDYLQTKQGQRDDQLAFDGPGNPCGPTIQQCTSNIWRLQTHWTA